jgi:predicted acetyltransferase
VLTGLMRAELEAARERSEPLAALYASEGAIYGRYGFGVASFAGELDLPGEHAALRGDARPDQRVRLVDETEAASVLPRVYDAVRPHRPGMLARSRDWWEVRVFGPTLWSRGGELARALVEQDGSPSGYALYRIEPSIGPSGAIGPSTSTLDVIEAIGATPHATEALWRYLLGLDLIARIRARLLPLDHPLLLLLVEPRRARFALAEALWVRLVDVGAALSARRYRSAESLVLEVTDAFCPWNAGRWALADGVATRTDDPPDLGLDAAALASAYLGGLTFTQLRDALLVDELTPGAVDRADDLFRTSLAPWCPEIF